MAVDLFMAAIKTILEAADLIAEVRNAFSKIEHLEAGQMRLLEVLEAQDRRIRELEAGLREARSDIRLDAVKETQSIVNAVQGRLYEEIRALSIAVDRISRSDALPSSVTGQRQLPDSDS